MKTGNIRTLQVTPLGEARIHSAYAASAAYKLAWQSGPGFCYDTIEWEAYDAAHALHMCFYCMKEGK